MIIVWGIKGKIIRTVPYCVQQLCTFIRTCEQFLKSTVGLCLGFRFPLHLGLPLACFCRFVPVLFGFVVL